MMEFIATRKRNGDGKKLDGQESNGEKAMEERGTSTTRPLPTSIDDTHSDKYLRKESV